MAPNNVAVTGQSALARAVPAPGQSAAGRCSTGSGWAGLGRPLGRGLCTASCTRMWSPGKKAIRSAKPMGTKVHVR